MQAKYDVRVVTAAGDTVYRQVHDVKADAGVLVIEHVGLTYWVPLHLLTAPVEITKASVVH